MSSLYRVWSERLRNEEPALLIEIPPAPPRWRVLAYRRWLREVRSMPEPMVRIRFLEDER